MTARNLALIATVLGLSLYIHQAQADEAAPHGHSDQPSETTTPVQATSDQPKMSQGMMDQGMMGRSALQMPQMEPARGRRLFGSKGCVVCHAIKGGRRNGCSAA